MQYLNRQPSHRDAHHQPYRLADANEEIFEEETEDSMSTNTSDVWNEKAKFINSIISEGYILKKEPCTFNYMFFVISGSLQLKASFVEDEGMVEAGHFFVLSCDQTCSMSIREDAHLVIFKFISIMFSYNIPFFQELAEEKTGPYVFTVLPTNIYLKDLLHLIADGLDKGLGCYHFHKYCNGLLNVILRRSYPRENLLKIYYHIVGKKMDFRSKILQSYPKAHSVKEFAELMGMSRSAFVKAFSEEFGTNARTWLDQKKKEFIRLNLADPSITVKSLMFRCGFDTPSNFSRYFQQNFNCTPSYAIKNKDKFKSPLYYLKQLNSPKMEKKLIIDI